MGDEWWMADVAGGSVSGQLDVAFCIFGQLRDEHMHFPGIAKLARDLGAAVFISTWSTRGTKTSGPIHRVQIMRMLGYVTGYAMPSALIDGNRFNKVFPDFEEGLNRTLSDNVVREEQLREYFPDAVIQIEDDPGSLDFEPPIPQDKNTLRMLYKVRQCNELKREAERLRGRPFDVVVRLRPDILPKLDAAVLSSVQAAKTPPVALFSRGKEDPTFLDDVIIVSTSEVGDKLAGLFEVAKTHPQRRWDLIHRELARFLPMIEVSPGWIDLERWITEDFVQSQPRNRAHLFALLREGRVAEGAVDQTINWDAYAALLRAASLTDEAQSWQMVDEAVSAIPLQQQDAEFLARAAFILGRAFQRGAPGPQVAAVYVAEALCSIVAMGEEILDDQRMGRDLVAARELARRHGTTLSATWQGLAELAARGERAPGLRRLLDAIPPVLQADRLAQAERALAARWAGPDNPLPGAQREGQLDRASTTAVATADELVNEATARLQARDLVAAGELAQKCLSFFPKHLAGYLVACEVARASQDAEQADDIMRRAMVGFPDQPWTYAYFAYNAFRLRNFEVAATRYYDAVLRFPTFAPAAKGLADSLVQLKLGTFAASVLDSALTRSPADKSLLLTRASLAVGAQEWAVVAHTARRLMEQFPETVSEAADLLSRVPPAGEQGTRRDIYAAFVQMPVTTEDLFHRRLGLALGLDEVADALALWSEHAHRWPRSDRLDNQSGKLLRAALVAAAPADTTESLIVYLLTQPPGPSTAWYPSLVDVALNLRRAENHQLLNRLADWVLPMIGKLPSPGPVAYFARTVLGRPLPYEAFEALMDEAMPVMARRNLWIKLFDRAFRSIEDAQRYIRRYVNAGYPLAPMAPIAGLEGADAARCMFLLANARDPESAEVLLQRFRQIEPPQQGLPWSWETLQPQIAHRYILGSDAPAVVRRVGDRLRIGVCVSGQLRGFRQAHRSWHHLGWDGHDVTMAVHTWRNIGRRFPDNAAQLDRAFIGSFRDALIKVSAVAGYSEILRRYPRLFDVFRQRNDVQAEDLRDVYGTDLLQIDDDDLAPFSRMQNQEKMYYKVEKCHDLLKTSGKPFDLIFRMRPDKEIAAPAEVDWGRVHHDSAARRELYADEAPFVVVGFGYCIGDQFAVGCAETMECYSRAWSMANDSGVRDAGWLPPRHMAHSSFAYATLLEGVHVKRIKGVQFGNLISDDPLKPTQVRSLLLEDMNGAPRDDTDRQLLSACGE